MLIIRRNRPPRVFTNYRHYKPYLRQDFDYQCVYCTIHEVDWAGYRNFHVEHHKPKRWFPEIICDYNNLLYSCSVCGCYKGSNWPSNDPISDGCGYLNPCEHDFENHFTWSDNGEVSGYTPVAGYMIERLHLNRLHMVKLRRKRHEDFAKYNRDLATYDEMIKSTKKKLESFSGTGDEKEQLWQSILSIAEHAKRELVSWWQSRWVPPYENGDLR